MDDSNRLAEEASPKQGREEEKDLSNQPAEEASPKQGQEPAEEAFPKQGQEEEKNHSNQPALEAFSKWSNYLLVTTVAAVGWISSGHVKFRNDYFQSLSLWCLGVSVIFGIFTLALVPLISEQNKDDTSIYKFEPSSRYSGRSMARI